MVVVVMIAVAVEVTEATEDIVAVAVLSAIGTVGRGVADTIATTMVAGMKGTTGATTDATTDATTGATTDATTDGITDAMTDDLVHTRHLLVRVAATTRDRDRAHDHALHSVIVQDRVTVRTAEKMEFSSKEKSVFLRH